MRNLRIWYAKKKCKGAEKSIDDYEDLLVEAIKMYDKMVLATVEPPMEVPVMVDPPGEVPVTVDPPGEVPVMVDPPSEVPVTVDPPGGVPVTVDPPGEVPVTVDPPGVVPVTVDPPGEVPVTVDPPGEVPVTGDPPVGGENNMAPLKKLIIFFIILVYLWCINGCTFDFNKTINNAKLAYIILNNSVILIELLKMLVLDRLNNDF